MSKGEQGKEKRMTFHWGSHVVFIFCPGISSKISIKKKKTRLASVLFLTHISVAKMKTRLSAGKDAARTLIHCWRECKMVHQGKHTLMTQTRNSNSKYLSKEMKTY